MFLGYRDPTPLSTTTFLAVGPLVFYPFSSINAYPGFLTLHTESKRVFKKALAG